MKRNFLTFAVATVAVAIAGASTQACAQTAPADVQAVDLGLPSGLKWASCNVGATTPEGYGDYFAWGETETKDNYLWETYKYANGAEDKLTKYCGKADYGNEGFTDDKTVLEPSDDAATANWGGAWRMPTDAEWKELCNNCTWTWTTQNGVSGYLVSSKTNSNSIFLPATGYRYDTRLYDASSGHYRSSSLYGNNPRRARYLYFGSDYVLRDYYPRFYGYSVRPVQNKQEEEVVEPAYVPKPFTVAEGKQVTFSGGNLQYTQSTQTWAFAEQQYDMLGTDNVDGGTEQVDSNYGYYYKNGNTLADKIDLFGWSGSTGSAKWGISTSTDNADYSGDFVDWGTNTIGTDAPDTWRTLTKDEWTYLRNNRTNADQLIGVARISLNADGTEYANGLVLLPDDWTCPAGVTFKSGSSGTNSVQAYADYQTFTLSDWLRLEAAGAVFLPASGCRRGSDVYFVQYDGGYWSATPRGTGLAYCLYFGSGAADWYDGIRYYGQAVRLVKNYSNVSTDIARPSAAETAASAHKIIRNGQVLILRNGKTYTLTGVEVK